jgi:hypothetical protein
MKSLAERLKEKEAARLKEAMKRSGPVKCFSVRIPYYGHPHINTEGDKLFVQQRAREIIKQIRHQTSSIFYEEMKRYIHELDNPPVRATTSSALVSPAVNPTNPSPTTPAVAPLTSPGVSVREIDTTSSTPPPDSPSDLSAFEDAIARYLEAPPAINEDDPRAER